MRTEGGRQRTERGRWGETEDLGKMTKGLRLEGDRRVENGGGKRTIEDRDREGEDRERETESLKTRTG